MGIVEFNPELQSVKTHCTHTNTMSRGSLKQIPSAQTTLQIDIKNAIQDNKFSIFITIIIGSNYRAPNYLPKYWVTPQFNLIFSEEIIQYSRTFAPQVHMSWNQSHAPLLVKSFPKTPRT